MSNCLSVKLTGCLIPHGNRKGRGGVDQRDYRYGGRSQICLLNNSNKKQRVQTDAHKPPKSTDKKKKKKSTV